MKLFQRICKMKQPQLKKWLNKRYSDKGYEIYNEDGFLYLKPINKGVPVCFTAHMDTVHSETPKQFIIEKHADKTILSSPQGIGGDDRCGIYMIVKLLDIGLRPYVVFCEDEEIGCIGAKKFSQSEHVKEMEVNFIVELDRRNANDAVYYDCDNEEFENFITETTGYETDAGTFSDICEIAPKVGVAAVNLSCGYYREHTKDHYVVWEEMINTFNAAKKLCKADSERFEYIERKYTSNLRSYFDDGFGYGSYVCGTFTWVEQGELKVDYQDGYSDMEVIGSFLYAHQKLSLSKVNVDFEYY